MFVLLAFDYADIWLFYKVLGLLYIRDAHTSSRRRAMYKDTEKHLNLKLKHM